MNRVRSKDSPKYFSGENIFIIVMSDSRQEKIDAVLEAEYEVCKEQPFTHRISYHNTLDRITDVIDVDRQEAANVKQRFKDLYLRRYSNKSYQLNWDAFQRLSELRDDIPVSDELQDDIFDALSEEYKDNPASPSVSREDLHDSIDASELAIDLNLYLLDLRGYVTVDQQTGIGNRGYVRTRISDRAKSKI